MLLFCREVVNLLGHRTAIQSAFSRLKKWAQRDLAFSKGKCKFLRLGWNNPVQHYTLRTVWLEISFAEHQDKKGAEA